MQLQTDRLVLQFLVQRANNLEKGKANVFTHVLTFFWFFGSSRYSVSSLYYFPCLKNFLCPFLLDMSAGDSFSYLSSVEIVLVCPSFLLDMFSRYRVWRWQFFSFNTWKMLCCSLLASSGLREKSTVIWIVFSSLTNVVLHFHCFDFSFQKSE